MPKLNVQTTDELPTPEVGKTYHIKEVEQFTSAVRGFKGLRVTMHGRDGKEYVESLWLRDVVGTRSKLGSFISVLGKDTDSWVDKSITFLSWRQGDRNIELATPK